MKLSEVKAGQKFIRVDNRLDTFMKINMNSSFIVLNRYDLSDEPIKHFYTSHNNTLYGDSIDVECEVIEDKKSVKLSDLKLGDRFRFLSNPTVIYTLCMPLSSMVSPMKYVYFNKEYKVFGIETDEVVERV